MFHVKQCRTRLEGQGTGAQRRQEQLQGLVFQRPHELLQMPIVELGRGFVDEQRDIPGRFTGHQFTLGENQGRAE